MHPHSLDPSARKTALIVEDDELSSKLLTLLLEQRGYTVLTTRFGESAIELAQQYKPDLILMDVQLPGISGIETTRLLKADRQTSAIPIIAVTALVMPGDEANILRCGCDAYVSKPFDIAEFLKLVERVTTDDCR